MRKSCLFSMMLLVLASVGALHADEKQDVAAQIEALQSATGKSLYVAIDNIGRLGPSAQSAVKPLSELLTDSDPEIRWRAARAIGAIGAAASPGAPGLTEALGDENPVVRAQAAYALGLIGGDAGQTAVPELVKAVADSDNLVRRAALRALQRIKPPREVSIPLMTKILTDSNPEVVMGALHTLAEMGPEGVPVLTEALNHNQARYWAMLVLSEMGPAAKAAVPKLTTLANDEEPEVRMQAILALGEIGPDAKGAAPTIKEALTKDEHNAIRYAAAYALGKMGAKDARSDLETTLAQASSQKGDKFLAIAAAHALDQMFPEDEILEQKTIKVFVDGLQSDDRNIRMAAVRALAASDAPSEVVAPKMVEAIAKADSETIGDVIAMLSSLGKDAVPRVKRGLANKDLRKFAIVVLRNIGPNANEAVPELVAALDTEGDDEFVREVAFVLGRVGAASAPAAPKLAELLKHPNERVRYSAAYALGSIGTPATDTAPALVAAYNSDDEFMKIAAIWALLKIRPGVPSVIERAIPLMTKGLSSERPDVRIEAAKALGSIGPQAAAALPALKKLLDDEHPQVQNAAKEAIASIEK